MVGRASFSFATLCAASLAASALSGCALEEVSAEDEGESASHLSATASTKQVTVCFAGAAAGDPLHAANRDVADLCERMPGLVRGSTTDPRTGRAYPFFLVGEPSERSLSAVIRALDTDGDGRVGGGDELFVLNVVGYSWGGFNARWFAQAFTTSPNVAPERRTVARLFALDPFEPTASRLDVPSRVQRFWELRHSVTPADDCSQNSPLGPYRGLPPRCASSTVCTDYDFSLSPDRSFRGVPGEDVGHCEVPHVARDAVLALTLGRPLPPLPPTRPVASR